jgi:hypothetical protein
VCGVWLRRAVHSDRYRRRWRDLFGFQGTPILLGIGASLATVKNASFPPGGLVTGVGTFNLFAFTNFRFVFWILLAVGGSLLLDGAEEPR